MTKGFSLFLDNPTAKTFISSALDLLEIIENDWALNINYENRMKIRTAATNELYKAIDELERLSDIDNNTQGRGY